MHCWRGISACALAGPTNFGANPAMFMSTSVALALLSAKAASFGASLQDKTHRHVVPAGAPRPNGSRGGTKIGAIQVQPNTLAKLDRIVLAQTRVGARGTRLSAVEAKLNATGQRTALPIFDLRMRANHCLDMHGNLHVKAAILRISTTTPVGRSLLCSHHFALRACSPELWACFGFPSRAVDARS